MGLRRALAAPLQASPFILASLYAIIRALLKERPWSTQARAQKELTDAIPRVSPGTRVCVYGLSANPPTGEGGHATIVAHLRRMFDEVWVLPVYRHAFESKSNLAPYDHRVRMCELAFGLGNMTEQQRRTEKVKVLDVERAVVRAAWDRHRVAEEEAKRVRADAHARRRGGGAATSSPSSSRGDGSAPPNRHRLGVVRGALAEGRGTPPMSPSASIASDAPISPFKSPTTIGAEPSAGPGATNVRSHHPEVIRQLCSAAQGGILRRHHRDSRGEPVRVVLVVPRRRHLRRSEAWEMAKRRGVRRAVHAAVRGPEGGRRGRRVGGDRDGDDARGRRGRRRGRRARSTPCSRGWEATGGWEGTVPRGVPRGVPMV